MRVPRIVAPKRGMGQSRASNSRLGNIAVLASSAVATDYPVCKLRIVRVLWSPWCIMLALLNWRPVADARGFLLDQLDQMHIFDFFY